MGHHLCVPWLNQGDNLWPPAIATQLEELLRLRLFAHTRRQVELKDHGRRKTKDIQREEERAKLYAGRCVSCF